MSINTPKIEYQPNILVISGGGSKGISFIGALIKLQEVTSLNIDNIKILSGSSIGGIICTAICLNYSLQEIKEWFLSTDFSSLCPVLYDDNYSSKILPQLYKNFSLSNGTELRNIIIKTFIYKCIDINITFKELYIKTNKLLVLSGSNINTKKAEYFSYEKTPDMKVLDSLLITTGIPYIFPYTEINNNIYVDGHLFDPFPIKGCGKKNIKENKGKILGIISISQNNICEIKNIKQYTFSIIEGLSFYYIKKSTQKYKKYIISIEINKEFFDLKTSKEEMEKMFKSGEEAAYKYILTNKYIIKK